MDIRRLAHLVALADTRSYSRAARQVHLSQPAFSRSIQAAEAELRLDLFERGVDGINCTPAGQFVIERARRVLSESAALDREVALFREGMMGDLAIAIGPHVARLLLMPLLLGMRARHPQVNCSVQIMPPRDILRLVQEETFELGLASATTTPATTTLAFEPLFRYHAALVCRADHPLAKQRNIAPEAIEPFGIAMTNVSFDGPFTWSTLMETVDPRPLPVRLIGPDVDDLVSLALATDIVLLVSREIVHEELAAGALVPLHTKHTIKPRPQVSLVSLANRTPSPAAQAAIRIVRETAHGIVAARGGGAQAA